MGVIKGVNIKLWTYKYISTYMQNVKNLDSIFWAIHMGNMHANFQASSFSAVGREWGDRWMHTGRVKHS